MNARLSLRQSQFTPKKRSQSPAPKLVKREPKQTTEFTGSRVQPGDIWQLGKHRLLCGDCTDKRQVERLLQGERPTLTITSPPYNIGGRMGLPNDHRREVSKYLHHTDALPHADYLRLLETFTENALCVSEVVIVNVQMLAPNKIALIEYWHRFRHDFMDVIVWDKGRAQPAFTKNVLNSRFEWLLFFTAKRSKGITPRTMRTANFHGTISNVYAAPPQSSNRYFALHAATFPLHLPLWLMTNFDAKGGNVFDPFLGTGTTLMAAEQLGRVCFGMEIDPVYCETILSRWEEATGRRAVRIAFTADTKVSGAGMAADNAKAEAV